MSYVEWGALALLAALAVTALVRLLAGPVRVALRLLGNAALGFGALWLWNLAGPVHLGLNLASVLVLTVLGAPGFILLLLLRWVLT